MCAAPELEVYLQGLEAKTGAFYRRGVNHNFKGMQVVCQLGISCFFKLNGLSHKENLAKASESAQISRRQKMPVFTAMENGSLTMFSDSDHQMPYRQSGFKRVMPWQG
ncbi:MAG: hypothetical protein WBQ60_00320 [Asticcacaulis sp.]